MKKMYEQHRDQLLGTQFNVETLQFQAEQAEITALSVQAMQAGHAQMKKQQERMSVEQIERLQDEAGGVFALLEVIASDFDRTSAATKQAEQKAEAEFLERKGEIEGEISTKEKDKTPGPGHQGIPDSKVEDRLGRYKHGIRLLSDHIVTPRGQFCTLAC